MTSALARSLRLSLGTLTAFPTKPPGTVDRGVGSWAMTLAPPVGALLSMVAAGFVWLLARGPASPMLVAALTIGLLALLTRGIHLDGLADTVDGLGSAKPPAAALEVMRRSDVGPFGVVTLLLVLLAQTAALAQAVAREQGAVALVLALVVSRLLLPMVCSRGIPAARPAGLGRLVAGSVSGLQLLVAVTIAGVVLAGTWALAQAAAGAPGPLGPASAGLVALLAGALLCRHCVRRLGGVTGDVMGACVEASFTAALVTLALL